MEWTNHGDTDPLFFSAAIYDEFVTCYDSCRSEYHCFCQMMHLTNKMYIYLMVILQYSAIYLLKNWMINALDDTHALVMGHLER